MNKPLILVIDELHDSIIELINTSNLPASQVQPILREIYQQIITARQAEATQARQQYDAELMKEQEEKQEAK